MARTGLRILMTADAVGGVWQYATELSRALAACGHQITLALLGPAPSADQRRSAEQIAGVRFVETGLPLDWLSDGPQPVIEAASALARLAREEGAHIVHCNMPALAGAAEFPVPLVVATHGCIATWWQAARSDPLAPEYRWHEEMTRQGLLAADAVVAPSASYARTVQTTYGLPHSPRVIHNGRQPLAPGVPVPQLRAALTVGRHWDPVKNATFLDAVAARLQVPFLAAGPVSGPHAETVALRHLQLLGHVDSAQLGHLLAQRPVFVSAATFEPFGLAVLEAAQAGCPLVLSDIPTFHELWDGCALFADPADADAFTHAIERLLDGPRLAADLSRAATERAERFTPAAMAAAMTDIYADVLEPAEAAA